MNDSMKYLLEQHSIGYNQQTIHISGERMRAFCTDISGKWVPIQDVMKLVDRIQELEKELYGSR
ncbi:hypothetical protein EBU71_07980 [bacterium]|nr:hypothetical protein [Candidatus Elulimicrobium humile]